MSLRRPLLLEGEAGVGKTEVAKVLAAWTGGELIRLQCYEGIDAAQAVYDWDYGRQLLHLRAAEASGESAGRTTDALEAELYQERFLVKRALLRAIEPRERSAAGAADRRDRPRRRRVRGLPARGAVRLADHGPRARRCSAPSTPPLVVLTSNRTRDVHDALKRRCLYHWVEHPELRPRGGDRAPARARRSASARPPGRRPPSRRCASSTCTSRPASPRRSTGPRRSAALGVTELDERAVDGARSARCSSTARTTSGSQQHGVADIVKQALGPRQARP